MRKLYIFIVSMLVAVAASAASSASLNVAIQSETDNYASTANSTAEATIDGGVVTVKNFLQGGKDITFTVYSDGSVETDWTANANIQSASGSSFVYGNYLTGNWFYYYSFAYNADAKTLKSTVYGAGSEWVTFDITIDLPKDFVPQEVVLPSYLGVPVTVKATVSDWYKTYIEETETIDMTIYIDGNTINIPNYLGGEKLVTYTLSDGAVSGGVKAGYADVNFDLAGANFNEISSFGISSLYYDDTRIIEDSFYAYETDSNREKSTWFTVKFELPKYLNATASLGDKTASISLPYKQGLGKIQFTNFLSTGVDVTFNINELGTVTNDVATSAYYTATFGALEDWSIYLTNSVAYISQKYAVIDGVKTLSLRLYNNGINGYTPVTIPLPNDFEPAYVEKNSQLYPIVDGVVSDEAIPALIDVSVDGSKVNITNVLNIKSVSFGFTVQSDGVVTSTFTAQGRTYTLNPGGFFTNTYAFNGDFYARLIDIDHTYNTVSKELTWKFGLTTDATETDADACEQYAFIYKFGDDFVPAHCTANIYGKNRKGSVYVLNQDKTASLDLAELDNRSVTLTNAFNVPTDIKFSWDKSGKLSWEGGFDEIKDSEGNQTYYTIGGKEVGSFTIGDASKHVIDGQDEYLELILTSDGENPTYQDAIYRVFIAKASEENTTLTAWTYKWDESSSDYDYDSEDEATYVYTIEDGVLTIENFLDSEYDITLQFYNKVNKDDDEGAIGTSLQEGEIYNTYTIFGTPATVITYEGDEYQVEEPVEEEVETEEVTGSEVKPTSTDTADSAADSATADGAADETAKTVIKTYYNAGWYVDGRTKYAFIDFGSGDDWYEFVFAVPEGVVFTTKPANSNTSAVNTIAVEDNNEDAPVEYFNLQGVRVNNPANGLYIRRQGSKVTKVIVK